MTGKALKGSWPGLIAAALVFCGAVALASDRPESPPAGSGRGPAARTFWCAGDRLSRAVGGGTGSPAVRPRLGRRRTAGVPVPSD